MRIIWAIAIGAAVGGVTRQFVGSAVQLRFGSALPWGTLLINVSGSFLLGLIVRYALATPTVGPATRALLTTGFCGGYTTFSTFSVETVALLDDGRYARAGGYALASVVCAIGATILGSMTALELLALRNRG